MKTKTSSLKVICILFSLFAANVSSAQYVDDFESGNVGWTIAAGSMPSSLWELGTPNYGATTGAHSGSNAWDVSLNSGYLNVSNAYLYTPVFNFTSVVDATLSFWRNDKCETNWDGTRMDYSIDGGATWNVLGAVGSGINWYTNNSVISSQLPGWDGNSGGWVQSSLVLSMLNNVTTPVQFRFVFTSDSVITYDGISIDDFSIDQVPPPTTPSFTFNSFTSQSVPCSGFYTGYFSVYGSCIGLNNGDTLNLNINFGNGFDSTYTIIANNGCYFSSFTYNYPSLGQYSIQLIITGPGGINDTITQYNQITFASCGNIEGQVYNDANANCILDSLESPFKSVPVRIYRNGVYYGTCYTDMIGLYSFDVPAGYTYTVEVDTNIITGYSGLCPVTGSYVITTLPSNNNNFGLVCNQGFDLFGTFINFPTTAPGFNVHVDIQYGNLRCVPVSGTVTLIIPSGLSYVFIPPGATVSGDTMIWNFSNLTSNSSYFAYNNMSVLVHLDTSLQVGDTICYQLMVDPISGDVDSTNNYVLLCAGVTGTPCDPNNKLVEPAGATTAGLVPPGTAFTYAVNFQNTGTAPAHNVYILDTLDADLDLSTFTVLNATHPMIVDFLQPDIVRFSFYNIMLPDSNANEPLSHGALQYSISAKSGLLQGTQIENTAHIYFDFNADVVTNTTLNTIDIAQGIVDNQGYNSILIYPQPAKDYITITLPQNKKSEITIIDMQGREVREEKFSQGNSTAKVDVSTLTQGVYLLKVNGQVLRFVKM